MFKMEEFMKNYPFKWLHHEDRIAVIHVITREYKNDEYGDDPEIAAPIAMQRIINILDNY